MREKHITHVIAGIRLDFRFRIEKKTIVDFSINVATMNEDKTEDVYRVDTKHGYLHEQRFWRDEGPRSIEDDYSSYTEAYHKKRDEVLKMFQKWVKSHEERKKKRNDER